VWDNDSSSRTFAGVDDGTGHPNPATAGPFGVVTYKYSTSTELDAFGARRTALSILTKTTGLSASVTTGSVPNPAIDSFDALDVLPPKERYDIPRLTQRVWVDTVTHPLDVTQAQSIQGRSTRTDPYT
jgi:hypothetical protein